MSKVLYNFSKYFPFRIVMTVEQISEADNAFGFCEVKQINEHLQVTLIRFGGNSYPRPAEVIDLPKVQVGNEQYVIFRPPNSLLWP